MNDNPGSSPTEPSGEATFAQRFFALPSTRLGWWAVISGILFSILWFLDLAVLMHLGEVSSAARVLLIAYGMLMLLAGLATGLFGLLAVTRRKERSLLVWLTLLPFALVVFLLLGEFLVPH